MNFSRFGVGLLLKAIPTITLINLWAAEHSQPRPLITTEQGDMDRYSLLIPGRLWLHRSYRLIGWGYRFPASLQFKAEYLSGNGEIEPSRKMFRVPLW